MDEVEEFVERTEGGEDRLRRVTRRYQETEVTSRGTEHRSVQEASVVKTSTVSSAAMTGGHLPLPFSLSDAIKHEILDPETGITAQTFLDRQLKFILKSGYVPVILFYCF